PAQRLLRQEGIVPPLFADGRERSVAWAEDSLGWERHDFLPIRPQRVCVRDHSPAHGRGEYGIADDRYRTGESADDVADCALGVPPREPGLDLQRTEVPGASGGESFRAIERLPIPDEGGRIRRAPQPVEVENVIAMSM